MLHIKKTDMTALRQFHSILRLSVLFCLLFWQLAECGTLPSSSLLNRRIERLLETRTQAALNRSWTDRYDYYRHVDRVRRTGSFIIKLMPDITADEFEQFKECLEAASCEIVYRLQDVFQGYVVRAPAGSPALPPDLISKLSEFIESIEEDHVMVVGQVQTLAEEGLYGLDRLDQTKLPLDNSYTFDYTGERVNVYIVDSGADVGHKEFEGRAEVVHVAKDIQQGDCIGIVAGKNTGVAKRASVKILQIMGCQEDTSVSEVVNAVNWVAANHKKPAIINLSLGLDPGQELPSQTLDVALNKLISLGVIVVSAAGNANADACLSSPPRNKGVISVGATDRTDSRASFSNYGQCVTLFACGVNIWSVKPNGGYAYKSGTSQASPFVAGVAALYLEANPSASPAQVMALLQSNAISGVVGSPNGSPNLLLQTIFKAPTAPIPPPSTAKNSSTTNNNTPPPVQNTQQRQSDKAKGIKINDNVTPSGTVGPMVDLDPPDSLVSNRQTDSKKITATTWAIIGGSTAACLLLGIAGIAVIRSRNKSVQAAQKHLFASNPRNSVFPPDTPLSSVAESPKLFSATGYPRSPTKSAEDLPQRRVSLSTSPRKKPLRLRLSISMQRASMMVLESPETPYMSLEDSIEYPPIADTDNRDISVATPATPSSQVFDSGDSLPVTISDRSTLSRKRSERPESMQDPAYFFAQQQPK